MYFCPLCTNESNRQGFVTLDSLRAHLDLFHCTISCGTVAQKQASLLTELEFRIENLVDSHLSKKDNSDFSLENRNNSKSENQSIGGGLLRRYARDNQLASAENEYLKKKLKEEGLRWRLELDEEKERYEQLEKQFRSLKQIFEAAQKQQADGKRKLDLFVKDLVGDVERLENQVEENNAIADMQTRMPAEQSQFYPPNHSLPLRSRYPSSNNVQSADGVTLIGENQSRRSRLVSSRSGFDATGRTSAMRYSDSGFDDNLDAERGRTVSAPARQMRISKNRSRDSISNQFALVSASHSHLYTYDHAPTNYVQPTFVNYLDEMESGPVDDSAGRPRNDSRLESDELALILVFRHLDALDLLKCALVSRKWHAVSRNPIVWQAVRLKNRTINNQILLAISKWCTETIKLTLENVRLLKPKLPSRRNLEREEKRVENGSLESGLESILQSCNGRLIFLKLVACSPWITDRALWLSACYCKNLQKVVYISDQFAANAPSLWALGASCRVLDTLIVPPLLSSQLEIGGRGLQFDDEALLMIARCFPTTLKVLCVGGRQITLTGLKYVAKSCQWLEALELDHCIGLTLRAAKSLCTEGLKSLQVLNLTNCDVSPAALKYFSDRLPQIRSIRVVLTWKDFPTPKHVETFLSDCQELINNDPSLKKILRLEERL